MQPDASKMNIQYDGGYTLTEAFGAESRKNKKDNHVKPNSRGNKEVSLKVQVTQWDQKHEQ